MKSYGPSSPSVAQRTTMTSGMMSCDMVFLIHCPSSSLLPTYSFSLPSLPPSHLPSPSTLPLHLSPSPSSSLLPVPSLQSLQHIISQSRPPVSRHKSSRGSLDGHVAGGTGHASQGRPLYLHIRNKGTSDIDQALHPTNHTETHLHTC